MTAWEDIQIDWANEAEKKNVAGILLWDLSAAFDTLDKDIFCEKIKLYGFQPTTVNWFHSFCVYVWCFNRTLSIYATSLKDSLLQLRQSGPKKGVEITYMLTL